MRAIRNVTGLLVWVGIMGGTAQAAYLTTLTADAPLVHYRFSETSGSAVADANLNGGAAYNGTYVGSPTLGNPGPVPPAFAGFSAGNTALTLATGQYAAATGIVGNAFSDSLSTSGGFTILAWIKTTQTTATNIFNASNNASGQTALAFTINSGASGGNSDSDLRLYFRDGSNDQKEYWTNLPAGTINDGHWHMLAVTCLPTGTNVAVMYVDGVAQTTTPTVSKDQNINSNLQDFASAVIGGNAGVSPAGTFNGSIDEFSIFGSALTGAQITSLYNSAFTAIPEPATLALFGLGMLVCVRRRR